MFAATDSNVSALALLEQVLTLYDLGAVTRCRFYHRGLNDTYKVETSQGDSYFLRVYCAGWRSPETFVHRAAGYFAAGPAPVWEGRCG